MAALLLLGVLASSASAATIFSGELPGSFTFTTSSLRFNNVNAGELQMNCTKVSGTGSVTSNTGGTFSAEMNPCKLAGLPCEAVGGGNPLFKGTFELVQINPTTTGIKFSPAEVAFRCPTGTKEEVVRYKGSFLATIGPINTLTTSFTVTAAAENGFQKYRECEDGAGCAKGTEIELTGMRNQTPWASGSAESTILLTTSKATKIIRQPIFSGELPGSFTFTTSSLKLNNVNAGELQMNCTKVSGTGSVTSNTGGTFSAELNPCKLAGVSCEALSGGNPMFKGTFELVQIDPTTTGILFSPAELAFKCGTNGEVVRYKVEGGFLGTIGPLNTLTTSFTATFEGEAGTALQKYRECEGGPRCVRGIELQIIGTRGERPWAAGRVESSIQMTMNKPTKIL